MQYQHHLQWSGTSPVINLASRSQTQTQWRPANSGRTWTGAVRYSLSPARHLLLLQLQGWGAYVLSTTGQ